jgi:hypothetical protein
LGERVLVLRPCPVVEFEHAGQRQNAIQPGRCGCEALIEVLDGGKNGFEGLRIDAHGAIARLPVDNGGEVDRASAQGLRQQLAQGDFDRV